MPVLEDSNEFKEVISRNMCSMKIKVIGGDKECGVERLKRNSELFLLAKTIILFGIQEENEMLKLKDLVTQGLDHSSLKVCC